MSDCGPNSNRQEWYVYIIKASDDSLYTGITTDVERRFSEHSDSRKGARFFRGRRPVEVVHTENHPDRSSALRRESEIKKLTRDLKLKLIGIQPIKPPGRPC
ncbi:MAG: GIY-YIG nuclease family protein [Xanthomonadales bacterium]|nr:GIY-YIG nuclease family protein [Xanthomonadales bacterium]